MSEKKALRNALIKLGICVIFSVLYCLGGMEGAGGKVLRRFIAPAVLAGGMFYFSRDWKSLLQLPLMFASLSLGYGADTTILKILKRALYGLANGATTSGYNLLSKKWLLVGMQVALVVSMFVCAGVWNPFPSARVEELFFGIILPIIPLFSVKELE